jgi:hypothetical protein
MLPHALVFEFPPECEWPLSDEFTFPHFRPLRSGPVSCVIRIVVSLFGKPVGLGLAQIPARTRGGQILSLAVTPAVWEARCWRVSKLTCAAESANGWS